MEKLIIHHGDRVTEHELRDAPLTIGRDPECDLFFADKKLSRRHARVERAGVGLRLVDLESRNGTWVNEERIDVRDLVPGDEIRLGGLRIYIEGEPEQDEADQSTLYLGAGTPPSLDTGTVALSASAAAAVLPPEAAPLSSDDSSTVFLRASAAPSPSSSLAGLDEGDETLKKPEPEKTVVFAGQPPRSLFDTGTVVYRAQADPSLQDAATRRAPPKAPPPEEVELVEDVEASLPALTASMTYIPAAAASGGRGWAARFAPLAAGLGVFALLVVALPLLRILSAALVEESSSRGRALVGLLAAANEAALAEGRAQDVSIERVESEPGVVSAYILAPTGEVLAPKAPAGETPAPLVTEIDGLTGGIGEVRSFHEGRASSGDRVLAQPVMNRGRRVGVAVLSLRSPAVGSPWVALLLGSLLLAIAVLGVVLLARKMTVSPLNDLRLEVDALGEGRRAELPVERPYSELSQLASSLNRVLASRQGFRGSEPLDPRKPGALGRH